MKPSEIGVINQLRWSWGTTLLSSCRLPPGAKPCKVITCVDQLVEYHSMMLWCVCKHLHFKEINDKPCQTLRCPIVRKTHMGLSCSIFRHNHILHSLSSLIPNYQVAGFNMSKNRLGICVSCVCVVWVYLYIYIYCPAASIARTISLSLQRYLRGVGVKHLSTVRFF